MGYLYLDTARLGQTSPSALQTQFDFARLTAEQPSTLYFDRFLADGIQSAPDEWTDSYPGLNHWGGVRELRQAIKRVAFAPTNYEVAIASRSLLLLRAAVRMMFRVCNNVLTVDCCWPAYQAELLDAAARTNRKVECAQVRSTLLSGEMGSQQLIQVIALQYEKSGCDGLFLPMVDNLGVRFPIRGIVKAISEIRKPRFVLVDGVQAVGHLPDIECHDVCDLFLAGCHKWLGGYFPMGFAIYGRPRTRDFIRYYLSSDKIDDPLHRFSNQMDGAFTDHFSETVNVGPMFTCRSAIEDAFANQSKRQSRWRTQLANAAEVRRIASVNHWQVRSPDLSLQSGILLLDASTRKSRNDSLTLKRRFADNGVVASAYDDGTVRFSMPRSAFTPIDYERIEKALSSR